MSEPYYATVEQLMAAADVKSTSNETERLRRLLDAASRRVEQRCHRHFYPLTAAYTFEPDGFIDSEFREWTFWLNKDLLSVSAITSDGTAVASYTLQPARHGPPYNRVLIDSGSVFVITGEWGYSDDTTPAGALAEALDASETDVDVTDSSQTGIGDLLHCESEKMVVTGKALKDTTANVTTDLAATVSDNEVAVNTGALVKAGEVITVGAERMKVMSISGNDLQVVRAFDGSTLAAHTQPVDVYAPRTLTVERGAAGSTAVTHDTATALTRNLPPAAVSEATIAEALVAYAQESSAYARVVGSGDNQRESGGIGLTAARKELLRYRRVRMAAI
jgi:hypothetical protein